MVWCVVCESEGPSLSMEDKTETQLVEQSGAAHWGMELLTRTP